MIRFSKGTVVRYDGSWISRGPITGYGAKWQLDGTAGTLKWTFRGEAANRQETERVRLFRPDEETLTVPFEDIPHWDRAGALAAFADTIEGAPPPPTLSLGSDNLNSLDLMFGLIASSAQGGVWLERNGHDWRPASKVA